MIKQIKNQINPYSVRWIKRRSLPGNPQILNPKNIYILPSGFGWAYGVLVLSVFTGAINYQISTIFLMTFLLAVVGLVSAWETHANLKELTIAFISIEDAEQGRPAQLKLLIQQPQKKRFSLDFQIGKQAKVRVEKVPNQGLQIIIPIETNKRGYFALPRIVVSSQFPFNIFCAWSYIHFDEYYYVYPQAVNPGFWPAPVTEENDSKLSLLGQDELYDLKQIENPWVQPNRIAWKIAAKGQGWYLKTMSSTSGDYWLFRLSDLMKEDLETKLQYMSYCLQTAEANGYVYGMELGGSSNHFAQGEEHLNHLL